jgi:aryl-alcohol dehydrogenase-like predicted oxidoreductase
MKYRHLGKTGISVSEIGFGAWGIGGEMWQGADDSESMRALHKAVECGVNFFDTALAYGRGHSEELIGKLLKEHRGQIYVATKIPPKNMQWPARKGVPLQEVFPKQYVIECTHRSLKNLKVDRIDLQQLHVWNDAWTAESDIWEAIDLLKTQGKIQSFGISINDHQPDNALEAVKTGKVDSFQVIYNIFDQSPEDELFPNCLKENIGIIARVPFDEGSLTGGITPDTIFPPNDWRNRYFSGERKLKVHERVQLLKPLLGDEAHTLPELALRFCLSHHAVSTVIPGMRTVKHVLANAAVSDGTHLTLSMRTELQQHRWIRNFYTAEGE